jgi:hypothetical protein
MVLLGFVTRSYPVGALLRDDSLLINGTFGLQGSLLLHGATHYNSSLADVVLSIDLVRSYQLVLSGVVTRSFRLALSVSMIHS